MATYSKHILTGSTYGRGIAVTATTSGAANTIHTVLVSVDDEVWVYAQNTTEDEVSLTVWFGGTTATSDQIYISVPSNSGLTLVVAGLVLGGNLVVKAHAERASEVILFGYVNRLTP